MIQSTEMRSWSRTAGPTPIYSGVKRPLFVSMTRWLSYMDVPLLSFFFSHSTGYRGCNRHKYHYNYIYTYIYIEIGSSTYYSHLPKGRLGIFSRSSAAKSGARSPRRRSMPWPQEIVCFFVLKRPRFGGFVKDVD